MNFESDVNKISQWKYVHVPYRWNLLDVFVLRGGLSQSIANYLDTVIGTFGFDSQFIWDTISLQPNKF